MGAGLVGNNTTIKIGATAIASLSAAATVSVPANKYWILCLLHHGGNNLQIEDGAGNVLETLSASAVFTKYLPAGTLLRNAGAGANKYGYIEFSNTP